MPFAEQFILFLVLVLTVFWQLAGAVALGLVLAAFVFMKRMSDLSASRVVFSDLNETEGGRSLWADERSVSSSIREKVVFKHMDGPMFFGVVSSFRKLISGLGDIHLLVIRMEMVPFVDQSGIHALEEAIVDLHRKQVVMAICGANPEVLKHIRKTGMVPKMIDDRLVFEDLDACNLWLSEVLQKEGGLAREIARLEE